MTTQRRFDESVTEFLARAREAKNAREDDCQADTSTTLDLFLRRVDQADNLDRLREVVRDLVLEVFKEWT